MSSKKIFLLAVISFFLMNKVRSQETLNATIVQQQAVTKAKKENKQVLLIFHASWCGWCHHMDSLLTKTKIASTINKHFVLTHVTILEHDAAHKKEENPGGMELFEQYGGNNNTGIPYWVVLNDNGKLLANSRLKSVSEDLTSNNGDNIGCPSEPQEVEYFITVLKKTSGFSLAELEEVRKVFGKK